MLLGKYGDDGREGEKSSRGNEGRIMKRKEESKKGDTKKLR